jgi:hypothetical protein
MFLTTSLHPILHLSLKYNRSRRLSKADTNPRGKLSEQMKKNLENSYLRVVTGIVS